MNTILVIHERDHDDNEVSVVGVADSVEKAEAMIKQYYGRYEELSHQHIGEGNIEYKKLLLIENYGTQSSYKVSIWLEWFTINEV